MIRALKNIPPYVYAILLLALPMLGIILNHWHSFPPTGGEILGIADPDPWLRLTLVRDWLSGGSWYDHTMHKSNAPYGGISSPWTRPIDLALALFTWIQPHAIDLTTRIFRAALIVPLCWAMLMMAGMIRATRALTTLRTAPLMAAFLLLTALPLWGYFSIGNADHHGLLAALFICALGGVIEIDPSRKSILLTGCLFALQLWVSPEALVLIGGVYAWYGLLWLFDNKTERHTRPMLASVIAFASMLTVMIERRPSEWFTPVYDTMSVVYVFILAIAALVAWALTYRPPALWKRLIYSAACTIGGIACVAIVFPKILHGPLVDADPYIFTNFLPLINEAQPPSLKNAWMLAHYTFQPLLALGLCLAALYHRPAIFSHRHLAQWLYFFALTFGLYVSQQRFYYYMYPVCVLMLASMFAAVFAPEQVSELWPARPLARRPQSAQMLCRLPMLGATLVIPLILMLLGQELTNKTEDNDAKNCNTVARQWIQNGELNKIEGGKSLIVLARTDLGGEIMFFTPDRIVASNYHREGQNIRYVWDAPGITDAENLRFYLAVRSVDALLLCPERGRPKGSVIEGLVRGAKPPAWLERIEIPTIKTDLVPDDKDSKPAFFLIRH